MSVFQWTSVAVAGAKVDPLFTFTSLFIIYFPSFLKLFLNTLITQNLTTCLLIDFRNFLIWDVFFVIPVLKQLLLLLTSQLYWADIDFLTTSISIFLGKFDTKTQSSFLSRKGANTQSLFFWSGFSLLNVYLENRYSRDFERKSFCVGQDRYQETHKTGTPQGLRGKTKLLIKTNSKFPKLLYLLTSTRIQISKADSRLATYYICIKNTKTINPTNGCHFMKTIYLPTPK